VEAIDELVAVGEADHSELLELLSSLLEEGPAAPVPRAPNQAEPTPTLTPISTPTPTRGPATGEGRNAVDHGIETPEARQATGKPEEDVLELRAYRRQRPARGRCLPPLQRPAAALPPTGRPRAVPLGGLGVRRPAGRGGRQRSRRPGGPAAQDRPGHGDGRVPVCAREGRLLEWKATYPGWSVRIIGTDISPSMVERPQAGHDSQLEVDRGVRFLTLRGAESMLDLDGAFQRLELGRAVAFRHRGGAA